nr:reverse transcriptase domain-containing protein [Tanacetum cinerariifolium]
TESLAEQAFWSQYSVQTDEPNLSGTTIVEELFTSFDQCLIDEVTEVQNIFKQMELAVEQHCAKKTKFQTKMENVLQESDRLLTHALSVEIVNTVLHDNVKFDCLNFVNSNTASTSNSGTLPSNTISNPKSDLKAITNRSGVSYDGPQILPPPSSLPPVVENEPKATKDTVDPTNNGNTEDVQPQAVHSKPVTSLISEPAIAPLTLRVGKEAITLNLVQTLRYSANYSDMTAKRIDVIDMAYEEYSQEVLGYSDTISIGNPTPFYDLIVSATSPTLTLFENSDFLLEEVDVNTNT